MALVEGAVIQEALGWALGRALQIINRGRNFPTTLQTNMSTLGALRPFVADIERYNQQLERPREEVQALSRVLQEGEELVREYSNISHWNFPCFPCYQSRLQAWGDTLGRTSSVNVQFQMARDMKQVLLKVTRILEVLREQFGHGNYGMGTAQYGAPENPDFTVGLESLDGPFNKLKFELLKNGVSFLNLTGFGGSGKTTLARKLCWDPQVRGKFRQNNIFFATFSKKPNLKIIVERLFDHFGLPEPNFHSNEDPSYKLRTLLEKRASPILLVLDDVWPNSEFLVEKFKAPIADLKILVTSRVALNLESRILCTLQLLSPEDSMTLFRHYAQLNNSNSVTPHNDLVLKAVRCGRGLPLALRFIGTKLRCMPIESWEMIVTKLLQARGSNLQSDLHSDEDVLPLLQNYLDVLEDESIVKECFMDLGLFPEGQMIPVSALIDIWTELHKLDEEFHAISYIYKLTTKNLSNVIVTRKVPGDADYYYNYRFLVQHDVLRDLAIHISNQNPFEQSKNLIIDIPGNSHPELWSESKQQGIARIFPECSIKQKQHQVAARSLSISSGETFNSEWWSMKPDKAEVLVLNLRSDQYTLPGFIKMMRKLKVVILTNYSFHPSQLHKFELLGSLSNLKRIRLQKVCVPSLCKLKNLRKLSLYMCNTSQAFGSDTCSFKEALPNLVDMNIDYCKDLVALPAGFCDIIPLENLSITSCHSFSALPQDIGNLVNLRVLRLNSCTGLIDLPDSIKRIQKLSLLDISYCVSLGKLPEDIGELSNLSKLYMMGCSRLSDLPSSVTKLEQLQKVICDEETVLLWKEHLNPIAPRPTMEVAKVDNNLDWLIGVRP